MRKHKTFLGILLFLAIASTCAVFGFYFSYFNGPVSSNHSEFASFGSFIGGTLGPIINLFAFIGLITTIYLQSKTLSIQINSTKEIQKQTTQSIYLSSLYNLFSSTNALIESLNHQINHDNELTNKGSDVHLEGNTERLERREILIKKTKEIYEKIEKIEKEMEKEK